MSKAGHGAARALVHRHGGALSPELRRDRAAAPAGPPRRPRSGFLFLRLIFTVRLAGWIFRNTAAFWSRFPRSHLPPNRQNQLQEKFGRNLIELSFIHVPGVV